MLQSRINTMWRALGFGGAAQVASRADAAVLERHASLLDRLFEAVDIRGFANPPGIVANLPGADEPVQAEVRVEPQVLPGSYILVEDATAPDQERLRIQVPKPETESVLEATIARWDALDDQHAGHFGLSLSTAATQHEAESPIGADAALQSWIDDAPMSPEIAVSVALQAQSSEDWEQALERWHEARQLFPDLAVAWASEAAMLHIMGRLEEAERLATESAERFPDSIDVLAQNLSIAIARENWSGADTWLAELERQFPEHGYVRANAANFHAMLDAGRPPPPLSIEQLTEQAREADQRRDWSVAAVLWQEIYLRESTSCEVGLGLGRALRESGQYDAADQVLSQVIAHYPDHLEVLAHRAEVPISRKDWAEGARRWQELMRTHGDMPVLWAMAANAYTEAGWTETAAPLLQAAVDHEPDRVELRVRHAQLAERQEDWSTAVGRWTTALQMAPDDLNIRNSRGDAIWQQTIRNMEEGENVEPAEIVVGAPPATAEATDAISLKELAVRFESLGDNCEFGIVQRRFGADPIGLFRFGAISAEALTALARESFGPLGNPEFVTLGLTSGGEYLISDTRGIYFMHSFVRKGTVDEPVFLRQQVRRLGYLRRKLLEDIKEGTKIFVYKSSIECIGNDTARAMHAALSQIGAITLLVIRQSDDQHPEGSLDIIDDRILVGYVGTLYNGEGSRIDFDSWAKILKLADGHAHAAPLPVLA